MNNCVHLNDSLSDVPCYIINSVPVFQFAVF
jgi:hypothetical protein